MKYYFGFALIICLSVSGCKTVNKTETPTAAINFSGPPTIVYKTKNDYSKNVAVTLSHDKQSIVNYPGVDDIVLNDKFPIVSILKNGYYLDNRGIGPDVAFTKYSYEEYSKLEFTPTVENLFKLVIDNDPITEMYNCGNRLDYTNIEAELNQMIENGELVKRCKKLK